MSSLDNLIKFTPSAQANDLSGVGEDMIEPRNSTTKRADRGGKGRSGGGPGSGNEGKVINRETTSRKMQSPEMLEYPKDIGRSSGQGHYIIFDIIQFNSGKGPTKKEIKSNALRNKTKIVKQQIALYMPENVDVNYATKYNDLAVGAFAELSAPIISNAIQNFGSGTGGGDQLKAVVKNANNAIRSGGVGAAADVATAGVVAAAKVFEIVVPGGTGTTNLVQQGLGKVITDKMEFFFEGVGRRTFSYTFNFIPASQKDSEIIFKIIEAFKMGMLPDYADGLFGGGTGSRTLTIPDIFDIKYMHIGQNGRAAENRYLNRVSTCHLTNMSVKYGDEKYTAHMPDNRGAPPQKSSITLQFTEIEIVTKKQAQRGF